MPMGHLILLQCLDYFHYRPQIKYFVEYLRTKMVHEILLSVIVVIIVNTIIVALLKFLFQLFFVIPIGLDYSNDLLYAKETLLPLKS